MQMAIMHKIYNKKYTAHLIKSAFFLNWWKVLYTMQFHIQNYLLICNEETGKQIHFITKVLYILYYTLHTWLSTTYDIIVIYFGMYILLLLWATLNKNFCFPAWLTIARPTLRYRCIIRRVSGGLSVGERSEEKIRCVNNLQNVK